METNTLSYSAGKQQKLSYAFLGIAVLGLACTLYMWFYADPIQLSVLVGGAVLAIGGVAIFLKLSLAPQREGEAAVLIDTKGIEAYTTPVAKAAGLIEWQDMANIHVYPGEIVIQLHDPGKFASRMSGLIVRDTFKASKGQVRISIVEVDTNADEVLRLITKFNR